MEKCPNCNSVGTIRTVGDHRACASCGFSVWPASFKEEFVERASELGPAVSQAFTDKAKGYFTMERADKFWAVAVIGGVVLFRGHRYRGKVKHLTKVVEILNLENDFLHAFVSGLNDPTTNKEELLVTLSNKFQFLSLMRGI